MKQLSFIIFFILSFNTAFSINNILPPLTATISGGTTVCQNATGVLVTFTGNGGTAPYTFTYTVTGVTGNQTISTSGTNSSVTLAVPTGTAGTFTYNLVKVEDSSAGHTPITVSDSTTIIVTTTPIVDFTFNNENTCSGTSIQFTSSVSTSGATNYSWDFGDSTTLSTQANPTHSYTSLGCLTTTFTVTLTVTKGGCTVVKTHTVTVKQKPDVNFEDVNATSSANQFSNCQNASLSNQIFSITVGNVSPPSCVTNYSINWDTANSIIENNVSFPISHTYNQLGVYTMTITALGSNGCSNTKTYIVKNISNPAAGILNPGGTVDMCLPTNIIQYTIGNWGQNSPGTTYSVDYGDGSPFLILNQDDMVTTSYYNSTNPSLSTNYPVPHSYTTNSCPLPKFTIKLIVTNACKTTEAQVDGGNTISKTIADFTVPANNCITSNVLFTNISSLGFVSGCIKETKFIWNFGDPASGSTNIINTGFVNNNPNANHTFSAPGNYTVTLTATNTCGTTTKTQQICIEPPLIPLFTLNTTSGCTPLAITATNNTVLTNQCSAPNYLWEVTHTPLYCATSTVTIANQTTANASYNFTESGTYSIKLTMSNSCGSVSTTQTVTVKKPPTVTISNIVDFCQSSSLTPVATISTCTNSTPTYLWGFPGGTPSSSTLAIPPSVTYATAGNHTITLAVTNECGTTTATSNTFAVLSAPTVQNETVTICGGVAFSVTPSNSTVGNTIPVGTTYSWSIPIVTGGMTGGAAGTNQTSISGTLNNSTSSVQTATYNVTPKIGTCSGTPFTVVVTVNPAAQVNQPTSISVCNGATTTAINFTTTNPSGTTFSWTNSTPSIGLAASGNGNIPVFTAVNTTNTPIIATIIVTPSFSGGSAVCSGVAKTFTITVNPTGQVNQPNSITKCNGDAVAIPFLTSNTGGTSTTYNWTNDTPSIGLPATGTGNLSFTATNSTTNPLIATIVVTPTYNNGSSNCIGTSVTFTITINPSAQVNQPTAISVCNGTSIPTITFATLNTSGTTSYTWTNSNTAIGLSASGTGDISSFTATNTGNSVLTATIIVTPSYLVGTTSCSGSTKQFTITVSPNASVSTIIDKVICNGSNLPSITFASTNTGGTTSYTWTNSNTAIGLSASGTGNLPSFTATNTGLVPITATISVTPSFTNGSLVCSGTAQTFTITVNPSAQVNSINNIEVCNGNAIASTVFSTNNSGGTTTYSWTNSDTSIGLAASGTGNIPTFTANNTGLTPITATITIIPVYTNAGVNCNGTNQTFTIKVNPSPTGTISGTIDVCLGASNPLITFTGSAGNPPYIFTYNINNGVSQTVSTTSGNSVSINAPTNTLGIYTYNLVNVKDSNATSCLNTISQSAIVTVNTAPSIDIQPTPTQSICVGGTISNPLSVHFINGTGTPTYQWYSNSSSATTGGAPVGTNLPTYTPPAFSAVGTFYYYVVISFSGNGCGSITSAAAEIVVVGDPVVSTQPLLTQTLCQNETPTNLTVNITGGIGTYSYQWYTTATATNTGGTAVGTNAPSFTPPTNSVGTFYYYCAITQSGVACSVNSNSATVIINTSPTIVLQPIPSTVCQNGTPTTLSFTYSNGVGSPTYQWYSNSSNSNTGGSQLPTETNPTFLPPSNTTGVFYYYCIITFPSLIGSCSSVATNVAIVTVNPQSTVDVQPLPTQSICVGGTIQNPLTVTFINGTGTPTYQWYSNSTNATTGGAQVGTNSPNYLPPVFSAAGTFYYYVVISFSGNGCGNITSATAEIIVVSDPIVTTEPMASQTLCQNAVASALTVVASGGIGTYSYQWYSNSSNSTTGGTLISAATTATFTPSTSNSGTLYYYCEITQPNGIGCNVSSQTSEVNVNIAPTISGNPTSSTVCLGQTPTQLTVAYSNGVGTPTYQWYSNTSNSNVSGTSIPNEIGATFNPPSAIAGTVYYFCIIRFPSLSGGCEIIRSNPATVIIEQIPIISNQNPTICSSATFTITPTNSSTDIVPTGTTYTWSTPTINPIGSITGATAQVIPQPSISQTLVNTTTAPATVTYTVTPTTGICVGATFTITVTINPATNPNAIKTDITCFGINNGSITTNITGGIPPYSITWAYPNGTNSSATSITSLVPGVYNLSITDAGGCPISNNYTIAEPTDIVITTDTNNNITCFGSNNGAIAISVSGGTGAYTYSWTKNGLPYATTDDISNLSPATYVVSVSDANNCGPKTVSFTITEPPILAVNLVSQTNVDCYGFATGAITINATGGTPIQTTPGVFSYTYSWTSPNGFTSANQNISNLIADTYNLTVTDNLGCSKNLTVTITQSPEIIINAITTPIVCYGDNNATITVTLSGGHAPYQVQWSNLAVGLFQNNLAPGDYTITVIDAIGCLKIATINIPSPPIFTVNPVVTNISCFGAHDGSIVLNFVGGIAPVNLIWSDGSPAGITRNNLGPGTYSVIITDSKPCTISRTFSILEPQPLVLSANTTNALDCNDANTGAINLLVSGGTPPFTYLWNNGTTTEDLTNIPAGNYAVTVTDSRGCTKTAQYNITRPNPLLLSVNTTTNANCSTHTVTQLFTAQPTGGVPPYQLNWSSGTVTGANNEFMTTTQNGLVTLTATDAIGCTTNYSLNVAIPILGNPSFSPSSIGYSSYGIYSILDPIQFNSTITGDYTSVLWNFGDGTFSNEINPIHTYLIPNDYYLVTQTVTYPFGCIYVMHLALKVEIGYLLVVPTAFTPNNNDGINDTLRPVTKGLKNVHLDIYDTWGSLIYSEVGDILVGWNGKVKGISSENGNYYAKVSGETFYGTIVNENHTFVLIK